MHTVLLLLLAACSAPSQSGFVRVCIDGARQAIGDDVDLTLSGVVTGVTTGDPVCGTEVSFEDENGDVRSVGVMAFEDEAGEVPIPIDVGLAAGAPIDVTYRYRMVWGDVAGVVVTAAEGVVLAADEGGWGGALEAGDVAGLAVSSGDDIVGYSAGCARYASRTIVFDADEPVEIAPVGEGEGTILGRPMRFWAIANVDADGTGSCLVSDSPHPLAWALAAR